jgi:hypothetical protein
MEMKLKKVITNKTCNNCKWNSKKLNDKCFDCTAKMIDRWEPNIICSMIIGIRRILHI